MGKLDVALMRAQKKDFIRVVSQSYPLSAEQIERFVVLWDWRALSRNKRAAWTEELIAEYCERWDWYELSRNSALPWSPGFIETHIAAGRISWGALRWQSRIMQRPELLALCLPHWSHIDSSNDREDAGPYEPFRFTSWGDDAVRWAPQLVVSIAELNWTSFSAVQKFPWTLEFIAEHADRLDWRRLSWNGGLPWGAELFERFADQLHWDHLSPGIPWTMALYRAYQHRIDWSSLARFDRVPWPARIFDELPHRIHWASPSYDHGWWDGTFYGPIHHENLEWTIARFERLREHLEGHFQRIFRGGLAGRWGEGQDDTDDAQDDANDDDDNRDDDDESDKYWTYYCDTSNWSAELFDHMIAFADQLGQETIDWDKVAAHAKTPWTDAFFHRHRAHFNPHYFLHNPHFPLTAYFDELVGKIESYQWSSTCASPALFPSDELIERYKDKWDWGYLSRNPNLSSALIDAYAEHWDWYEMARNKALTIDDVKRHKERFSSGAWHTLSRRGFAEDGELDVTLPWHWPSLMSSERDLQDYLDESTLERFLASADADRVMHRNPELEAAIVANPGDPNSFAVYGDWLQQQNDPQGELIALMHAELSDASMAPRVERAIQSYEQYLEIGRVHVSWHMGFIEEIHDLDADWRRLVTGRPCRFARGLSFTDSIAKTLSREDLRLLAELGNLERLSLRFTKVSEFSALGPLRQLRDLRLDHSAVSDLETIAALPSLEQLGMWDTNITDLRALAGAKNLHTLHTGHSQLRLLDPLAELPALVELDIRFTQVQDLSPLHRLTTLRRLLLDNTPVDDAEIARLCRALPNLEICRYADWPGQTTMLPFWKKRYRRKLPPRQI